MVVDIHDILVLQLSAIVVDFVLNVVGFVDINITLLTEFHHETHVVESLLVEVHHVLDVLVLLLREILLRVLALATHGAGEIIARVTDTFQLTHHTEHVLNFGL